LLKRIEWRQAGATMSGPTQMAKTARPSRMLRNGFAGWPRRAWREKTRMAAIETMNRTGAGMGTICCRASSAMNTANGATQGTDG